MSDRHPLWRPYGTVTPEELRRARVGERERLPAGSIEVAHSSTRSTSGSSLRPGAPAHAAAAGLSGYCWETPVIVTLVAGGPSYPSGLPLVAAFAAFCATLSPAGVSWPNCV